MTTPSWFRPPTTCCPSWRSWSGRAANYRLHTPNGLHARLITPEVAGMLKRANFVTLRLGVETTALGEGRPDRKLRKGELEAALAYLREAGFAPQAIGVYLLAGLPDQD